MEAIQSTLTFMFLKHTTPTYLFLSRLLLSVEKSTRDRPVVCQIFGVVNGKYYFFLPIYVCKMIENFALCGKFYTHTIYMYRLAGYAQHTFTRPLYIHNAQPASCIFFFLSIFCVFSASFVFAIFFIHILHSARSLYSILCIPFLTSSVGIYGKLVLSESPLIPDVLFCIAKNRLVVSKWPP